MQTKDFTTVTELAGDQVSCLQIASAIHRYTWAALQCTGLDVLEVACGSGPGLGLIAAAARKVTAVDITPGLVARVQQHYRGRIAVSVMDAEAISLPDHSIDVVLLFEALYYLPHPDRFVSGAWLVILLRIQQFDIEDQRGVGGDDAAGAASAIAEFRRNDQGALAADFHAGDTFVPAADHLLDAELETER